MPHLVAIRIIVRCVPNVTLRCAIVTDFQLLQLLFFSEPGRGYYMDFFKGTAFFFLNSQSTANLETPVLVSDLICLSFWYSAPNQYSNLLVLVRGEDEKEIWNMADEGKPKVSGWQRAEVQISESYPFTVRIQLFLLSFPNQGLLLQLYLSILTAMPVYVIRHTLGFYPVRNYATHVYSMITVCLNTSSRQYVVANYLYHLSFMKQ